MKKKLNLLFFILIMVTLNSFSVRAFEATKSDDVGETVIQSGDYEFEEISQQRAEATVPTFNEANIEGAEQEILNGLRQRKSFINLKNYNFEYDAVNNKCKELSKTYSNVLNQNPDLYYVGSRYYFYYSTINGVDTVTNLQPTYMSDDDAPKANFDKAVEKALQCVDDSMTDLEKALALHDYIVLNCEYISDEDMVHNAYGALVNQRAVCQGYSLAYEYLLAQVNVEATFVSSDEMCHGWNLVKIGDSYYHVDCTWDDPVNAKSSDTPGRAMHEYFLLSDSAIQGKANPHTGYSTSLSMANTKYDNYFWQNVKTPICYYNDCWYFIDSTGVVIKDTQQQLESNQTGGKIFSIDAKWNVTGSLVNYWQGNYSGLAVKDDKLYYNTSDSVIAYDLQNQTKESVFTLSLTQKASGSIYYSGILNGYNYNGQLFYNYMNSPNEKRNVVTIKTSTGSEGSGSDNPGSGSDNPGSSSEDSGSGSGSDPNPSGGDAQSSKRTAELDISQDNLNSLTVYTGNEVTVGMRNTNIMYSYSGDGTVKYDFYLASESSAQTITESAVAQMTGSAFTSAPKDAGYYYIVIYATEGTKYQAVTPKAYRFQITQRKISVNLKNNTKQQGQNDPAISYTYSGWVGDETPAFVGRIIRDAGETPGKYLFHQGNFALEDNLETGFKKNNYILKMLDNGAALTIEKNDEIGDSDDSATVQNNSNSNETSSKDSSDDTSNGSSTNGNSTNASNSDDSDDEYVTLNSLSNGDKITVKNVTYQLKNGAMIVTKVGKNVSKVTIKDSIISGGKTYKITKISKNVCKNLKKLKSVTFGKYIKSIEANAFRGCKNLKSVTFLAAKTPTVSKTAFKGVNKKIVFKADKKIGNKNIKKYVALIKKLKKYI